MNLTPSDGEILQVWQAISGLRQAEDCSIGLRQVMVSMCRQPCGAGAGFCLALALPASTGLETIGLVQA